MNFTKIDQNLHDETKKFLKNIFTKNNSKKNLFSSFSFSGRRDIESIFTKG